MSKPIEISERGFEFMKMVEEMEVIDMEFLQGMFPEINADDFASFLRDANLSTDDTAILLLGQLQEAEARNRQISEKPKSNMFADVQPEYVDYLAHCLTEIYWSEREIAETFADLETMTENKRLNILLYNYRITAVQRAMKIEDMFSWVKTRRRTDSRSTVRSMVAEAKSSNHLLRHYPVQKAIRLAAAAKLISRYQGDLYESIQLPGISSQVPDSWSFVGEGIEWLKAFHKDFNTIHASYLGFDENRMNELIE